MHSIHCGSAVFLYQALERRTAQETNWLCGTAKHSKLTDVTTDKLYMPFRTRSARVQCVVTLRTAVTILYIPINLDTGVSSSLAWSELEILS
jgi:hypothetical protein